MNKINFFLSIISLTAVVVIIERLLPATRMLLQPYDFIRLHEINQTILFLPVTIIASFFIIKTITHDSQLLKDKNNAFLLLLFLLGTYLFGAGEGWHEVASFTFNTYCNTSHVTDNLCGGLFINDYYAGNIIFFVGLVMMNISIMALSGRIATKPFTNKELIILFINSTVFALMWFAYAAFDPVHVGLFFAILLMLTSLGFFLKIKNNWRSYPYIIYSAVGYTVATITTFLVRFH